MTDRELLEYAAKAAGVKICPSLSGGKDGTPFLALDDGRWFAPLYDDGDALRLAVMCNINVFPSSYTDETSTAFTVVSSGIVGLDTWERWGDDKMAATRRAIVRAAAEIGRNMP